MTLDDLMFHASRYGNTEVRRERKAQAVEELKRRGPEALDYLVTHSHIKNIWFRIYAQQMVEQMPAEEAVPVLLRFLSSPEVEVRKTAVYFLGFYDAPGQAAKIMTLLDDEKLAGVAIRTLGKWKVDSAAMRIIPFLQDEDERRRIMAANALRDMGDPRAIPALIDALDDEFFTVRRTAGRALSTMGADAEQALVRALRDTQGRQLRAVVRTLGEMKSRKAVRPLRRLVEDADSFVREDAKKALERIETEEK